MLRGRMVALKLLLSFSHVEHDSPEHHELKLGVITVDQGENLDEADAWDDAISSLSTKWQGQDVHGLMAALNLVFGLSLRAFSRSPTSMALLLHFLVSVIVTAIIQTSILLLSPWAVNSPLYLPAEEYLLLPLVGHRRLFGAPGISQQDPFQTPMAHTGQHEAEGQPSLRHAEVEQVLFLRPLHAADEEMLKRFGQTETAKGQNQIRQHFRAFDSYNNGTVRMQFTESVRATFRSLKRIASSGALLPVVVAGNASPNSTTGSSSSSTGSVISGPPRATPSIDAQLNLELNATMPLPPPSSHINGIEVPPRRRQSRDGRTYSELREFES